MALGKQNAGAACLKDNLELRFFFASPVGCVPCSTPRILSGLKK